MLNNTVIKFLKLMVNKRMLLRRFKLRILLYSINCQIFRITLCYLLYIPKSQLCISEFNLNFEIIRQEGMISSHKELEKTQVEYQLLENESNSKKLVQSISRASILEISGFRFPIQIMKLVVDALAICFYVRLNQVQYSECCQIMIGTTVPFWKSSYQQTKFLLKSDILRKMLEYDRNMINGEMIELLEPFYQNGQKWFTPQTINRASKAFGTICEWIQLLIEWYRIKVKSQAKQRLRQSSFSKKPNEQST